MSALQCSCGETKTHVIARRQTSDGKTLQIWSDGDLTWAFHSVSGIGRPRTESARREYQRAAWLVAGDACIHESEDIADLFRAALAAVRTRKGLPGDMRQLFAASQEPKLRPLWEVIATHNDGTPSCRTWSLPRMKWPGLVIWHERGRYEVMRKARLSALGDRPGISLVSTGFFFATQRALTEWLLGEGMEVAGSALQ